MIEKPKYEEFMWAPGLRLEAAERVAAIHHDNMLRRMDKLEEMIERLEKRLWLTVYGVVAVILTEGVQSLLAVAP
ncbi:MAG: hypothetical protein AAF307_06690 [Pseudomonadota bacterium]